MRNYGNAETNFEMHRVLAVRKAIQLSKDKKINVSKEAVRVINNAGFNPTLDGSIYLSQIIYQLYHERFLLEKYYKRDAYNDYWNFNNPDNEHYQRLGDGDYIHDEILLTYSYGPRLQKDYGEWDYKLANYIDKKDLDLNGITYRLADILNEKINPTEYTGDGEIDISYNRQEDIDISYEGLLKRLIRH